MKASLYLSPKKRLIYLNGDACGKHVLRKMPGPAGPLRELKA
jgi:hypothetical protein